MTDIEKIRRHVEVLLKYGPPEAILAFRNMLVEEVNRLHLTSRLEDIYK